MEETKGFTDGEFDQLKPEARDLAFAYTVKYQGSEIDVSLREFRRALN